MSHSDNRALFFNSQIERFRRASLFAKKLQSTFMYIVVAYAIYISCELRIQFFMYIIEKNTVLRFH